MITIEKILTSIEHLKFVGNTKGVISRTSPLDLTNTDVEKLMWVNNNNLSLLENINFGTIICGNGFVNFKSTCNYIVVEKPRLAFKEVIEKFFSPKVTPAIYPTAQIHSSVKLGNNLFIGHNVVVEENCSIGNNVFINHNTVILKDTIIGDDVRIGSNNTIGGTGFGYEKDLNGVYQLIPHIGNVIIHNNVEIGNNVCIDRAVMGSTVLHENVKVDNLVHIAHGVTIGQNSLIISNSTIAGSTKIGDNVWMAPSATATNKVIIGNNAWIGIGAVVIKDVNEGETIFGNPGRVTSKGTVN